METVIILFSAFAMALIVMKIFRKEFRFSHAGRIAISTMFIFTGISHFFLTKGMAMMLPSVVPFRTVVIYITGLLEILFAIGFLFPKTRKYSGFVAILFLVAVLPSNIYAAIHHINITEANYTGKGLEYLWLRVPMQLFFIGWIYWFIIIDKSVTAINGFDTLEYSTNHAKVKLPGENTY